MNRRRTVTAPASVANLGPGYDVLAAAVDVELRVEVVESGEFSVTSDVEGVPLDRSNLVVRAFESLHPADGLSFEIASDIPLAAGLGSSAAAIVAGLAAADSLYELDAPLLDHAAELEGHPDNVAAALLGGFVVCADGGATRIDPAEGLEAVVATPDRPVSTESARAAMPDEVPMADAVHNVAHTALLMLGLARDDRSLLAQGLSDRLHQDRRAHLYPRSMELVAIAHELGAIGATIAGAGPTVLFWTDWQATGTVMSALEQRAPDCAVRRVSFAHGGVDVRDVA